MNKSDKKINEKVAAKVNPKINPPKTSKKVLSFDDESKKKK
jgi:hypothetical protein